MTAPLRSTQFYEGTPPIVGGVNTWTTAYTVPAGHRIIFKQAHVYNAAGVAHSYGIRLNAAQLIRQVSIAAGVNDEQSFWIVLNPAETLQVLQVAAGATFYILSGYLLYI